MSLLNPTEIYSKLPISARQLAITLVGYKNRRIRYGKHYREQRALLERSQYWSESEMLEYQTDQLARLLYEARTFTPAYRELPHLTRDELRVMIARHDFSALPILEKSDLRAATDQYRNRSRDAASVGRTSGTTGSPMRTERDRESVERTFAFIVQHRGWLGLTEQSRSVRLSGRLVVPVERQKPPFWMMNRAENQLLLSTYHLSERYADAIREKLERFQPEVIDGYPSAIIELGKLLGPAARFPSLKGIITTAETLDDGMRATLTDLYGCPVLDYYAASEGVPFVQECERGRYHIRPESGIFEFHDEHGKEVGPGETGELVVTSFCNFRTPLIRYRTGDLATRSTSGLTCECGRTLPVVHKIVGRREATALTTDGREIGLFAHRVLTPLSGIKASQIVQLAPDKFTVSVVPERGVSMEDISISVLDSLENVLGYRPNVEFIKVEQVPRGPNGKQTAFIRKF